MQNRVWKTIWSCIVAITLLVSFSATCFAKSLPHVPFEHTVPFPKTEMLTQYTPWIDNFHLLTAENKEAGNMGGMAAQRQYSIAISPFDTNIMLFGLDTTGIYRSTNGGDHWYVVSNGIENQSVTSIVFDPYHEGVVYALQVSGYGSNSYNWMITRKENGIYKSTDNGWSWKQVLPGPAVLNDGNMSDDSIQFDTKGNAYAYLLSGVFKSSDVGETWQYLGSKCPDGVNSTNPGFYVSPNGKTIITTSSLSGVRLSTDGGKNWKQKGPYDGATINAISVLVDPKNESHWHVTTGGDRVGEIFETFNSGDTWTSLGRIDQQWKVPFSRLKYGGETSSGTLRMFVTGNAANNCTKYSDDGGKNWTAITFLNKEGQKIGGSWAAIPITMDPYDPNTVWIGSGGEHGTTVSYDNGITWVEKNYGWSGHVVRQYNFDSNGYLWASMHDFAFFKSDAQFVANGDAYPTVRMWQNKVPRWNGAMTGGDIDVDPLDPNHVVCAIGKYSQMVITESFDAGTTWIQRPETGAGRVREVKFHEQKPNILYTTFFISRDSGKTWEDTPCQIYNVCASNNDYLVGYKDYQVWFSLDTGLTWQAYDVPESPWGIVFDIEDSNTAYMACESGHVIKVSNGEITVYDEKNGLGNERLYQIAQNPFDPSHMITCGTPINNQTNYGLFESFDKGETWHIVPGFPGPRCLYSVSFSPLERIALVGSYMGTFIYRYDAFREYYDQKGNNIKLQSATQQRNGAAAETLAEGAPAHISCVDGARSNGNQSVVYLDFVDKALDASGIQAAKLVLNAERYAGGNLQAYSYTGDSKNPQNLQLIASESLAYDRGAQRIELDVTDYVRAIASSGAAAKVMLTYTVKTDRYADHTALLQLRGAGGGTYFSPYIVVQ